LQITEDRKRRVIDLYFNQHKSYAEIAQIEKMSPRDIHVIIKEEETRQQKHKDQQQQEEIFSKAYELFSKSKKSIEVAIALNLREPKVSKLHKEYRKLKGRDILNTIHKETNGNTWPLWRLYQQLIKKRCMTIEQIVNVVETAIDKLPYMESLYEQVKEQVDKMQYKIQGSNKDLNTLNDEIASAKALLNSYYMLCERKRQEAEQLNNYISRLETVVIRFKNNNDKEYLKIKKTVEEEVNKFLTDGKVFLQFALASVIESIRRNTEKYNNLLVSNTSESSTSTPAQGSLLLHIEDYRDMILEEANRLYDNLLHHFTNSIMDNAAGASSSSSSSRIIDTP
jgi:hypothetical protein